MNYGYVENGIVIEGPRQLPASWRNVSGLDKMSQAALKATGWLPWSVVYGPGKVVVSSSIQIGSDAITETVTRREQTPEEQSAEEAARIESINYMRRLDYANEADPLFFKWQRGEGTQQDWLDKIAEIKARHPK
jgi:hypothetical protein